MQQVKDRRGFTLVELLLAIFLVGILAYFTFATPNKVEEPKEIVTVSNLSKFFQTNLKGDGEVICINKCASCYYISSASNPRTLSFPMQLKVKGEFILDKNDNPIKADLGRYKDKKICLRFRHYRNNSISQMILDLGDKVIFLPSYFGEGKEFNSINEAADWWVRDSQNRLKSRGDWH